MSSETSPLLAQSDIPDGLPVPNGLDRVVPIFLQAAHSPWPWLKQNVLCWVRGFVLFNLVSAGLAALDYKLEYSDKHRDKDHNHSPYRVFFQFSTVTLFLLIVYHTMVFAWTLTHFYYPNGGEGYSGLSANILNAASPPEQRPFEAKRFLFSLFYSASHIAAFMNTLIYWAVLVPQGRGHLPGDPKKGGPEIFAGDDKNKHDGDVIIIDDGWYKAFSLFNLFVLPTLYALLEILFLNSIKPQYPVPSHILALMFLAGMYLGWAFIGMVLTGHDPFYFFDPAKVGGRETAALACVSFVGLAPAMFSVMYALISFREWVIKKLGY